jgi:hypothetical protein
MRINRLNLIIPVLTVALLVAAAQATASDPQRDDSLSVSDLPTSLQDSIERSRYQIMRGAGEPAVYRVIRARASVSPSVLRASRCP